MQNSCILLAPLPAALERINEQDDDVKLVGVGGWW